MTNPERVDRVEILRHLNLIASPDQVIEVRAVGATSDRDYRQPHIIAGYFDDHEKLATAVANHITRAEGIYVTLNEINPALLARAANRLADRPKSTTGDADVLRRRIFYVDVDPARPAQVSATDAEHVLALARVQQISTYLQELGAPAPLLADSGNGGHALWRVDLPADDGGLVQDALRALARRFSDALVKVDETVGNPARIGKLYGTWARKGDSTTDRPHRLARILAAPEHLIEMPVAVLQELKNTLGPTQSSRHRAGAGHTPAERSFDLRIGLSAICRRPVSRATGIPRPARAASGPSRAPGTPSIPGGTRGWLSWAAGPSPPAANTQAARGTTGTICGR